VVARRRFFRSILVISFTIHFSHFFHYVRSQIEINCKLSEQNWGGPKYQSFLSLRVVIFLQIPSSIIHSRHQTSSYFYQEEEYIISDSSHISVKSPCNHYRSPMKSPTNTNAKAFGRVLLTGTRNSIRTKRLLLALFSTVFFVVISHGSIFAERNLSETSEQETLQCPDQPAGYLGQRQNISPGSPVLFLIPCDTRYPEFRTIWRKHLFPHMSSLNFDAVFLVEKSLQSEVGAAEVEEYGDIAFYDVPTYNDQLAGFYYRAMEGWRYGLNQVKQYEWFIRGDMDAFYCLHHIRLEINALELKDRPKSKPGIHWSHFYGDGAGGQNGPPVSDVYEIFNRYAAEEALKYAPEAMHDGIWDLNTVEVYGSNIADLSPNVTRVHDVRWAYGPGVNGDTFWNSGFLGYDFADECICANWLAIHLGKANLDAKFEQLASHAKESQSKNIEFDQLSPPVGAKLGFSAPYFQVGGCAGKKKPWKGCS